MRIFVTRSGPLYKACTKVFYQKLNRKDLLLVRYLTSFFKNFRFPKQILHDQGKKFDNKLFKRLSEITGIRPLETISYHPVGNGLCKRVNQISFNMLKTLPENFKSN